MRLYIDRFHMSQPSVWSVTEKDATLTAKTIDELVVALARYRKNNGDEVGDPEHDIAFQNCKKYPWLILTEKSDAKEYSQSDVEHAFVSTVWKTAPHRPVDSMERKERMQKCEKCPKFKALQNKDDVLRRRIIVLSGVSISEQPKDYGFCEHHLWVCSVACNLQNAKGLAVAEQYDQCWLK